VNFGDLPSSQDRTSLTGPTPSGWANSYIWPSRVNDARGMMGTTQSCQAAGRRHEALRYSSIVAITRPLEEHAELLNEQLGWLRKSAASFDEGDTSEAKRIAVSLRVLLHDTSASASLLHQMGLKTTMRYLDSAGDFRPGNVAADWPLISSRFTMTENGGKFEFAPLLGNGPPIGQPPTQLQVRALLQGGKAPRGPGFRRTFDEWWLQPVVDDKQGAAYSRKQLVMFLANVDGGAHVAPTLTNSYHALSRLNTVSLQAGFMTPEMTDPSEVPEADLLTPGSPVPACVRQIAWEFLESVPAGVSGVTRSAQNPAMLP